MAANRVCTGATEDAELGHLFGWRALSAENSFHGPGSLLIGTEGKQPRPAQQWRITPRQIEDVSAITAVRRPELDKPSLDAAGPDYQQRWDAERCGHLWAPTHATTAPATGPTPPATGTAPAPASGDRPRWNATAGWDQTHARPNRIDTPSVAELERMLALPSPDPADIPGDDGDELPDGMDLADPTTWTTGREPRDPHPPAAEQSGAREAALALIRAAGPEGTGASALERELRPTFGTTRQTIQGWLKAWADAGEVIPTGSGTKRRYVHRDHHRPTA
jgi:hypothetical protein